MTNRESIETALVIREQNYDHLVDEFDDLTDRIDRLAKDRSIVFSSMIVMEKEIGVIQQQLFDIDQQEATRWQLFINYCNTSCWGFGC